MPSSTHAASVVVSLQFEGTHRWPEASIVAPAVAFLSSPHRHLFHVRAWKAVSHGDRQIEFILLKRSIEDHLASAFAGGDLGRRSCEDLAGELIDAFGLDRCEVLEDGENGAVVEASR